MKTKLNWHKRNNIVSFSNPSDGIVYEVAYDNDGRGVTVSFQKSIGEVGSIEQGKELAQKHWEEQQNDN